MLMLWTCDQNIWGGGKAEVEGPFPNVEPRLATWPNTMHSGKLSMHSTVVNLLMVALANEHWSLWLSSVYIICSSIYLLMLPLLVVICDDSNLVSSARCHWLQLCSYCKTLNVSVPFVSRARQICKSETNACLLGYSKSLSIKDPEGFGNRKIRNWKRKEWHLIRAVIMDKRIVE